MKVTYDSYTNAIYAEVVDLNSSSEINITFPLDKYFTPPQPGYYWTSVYSWSGAEAANWGIVYYAVFATTQQTSTQPTLPNANSSMTNSVNPSHSALLIWVAVAVIVVLVLIIALLMVRRSKQ